ncbi:MAG: hypothetical protein JO077_22075 [Verrucomicrobia bacterium]|nr:hypothetical protein [Verrucomicrobiota bacterium]
MAKPNPIYAAPTELYRYLNVYGYKDFAPTELLPAERQRRTPTAKRQLRTVNREQRTVNSQLQSA